MKKALLIIGILFALLIGAAIALPIFFKPQIVDLVKEAANDNLNATLDFDDVDISLFRSFPEVDIALDGLTIINKAPFEGDTLAYLSSFSTSLSYGSLMAGVDQINSINLIAPRLNLQVNKSGASSWDIALASGEAPAPDTEASAPIKLAIQNYLIEDADVQFTDESGGTAVSVRGLTHSGSGDFAASRFTLETQTAIDAIDARSAGVTYLKEATINSAIDLDIDLDQSRYSFKENEIRVNDLLLKLDGWVQQKEEDLVLQLDLAAPDANLKSILSMIPALYRKDFDALTAQGAMSLSGKIRGELTEKHIPTFDLNLAVSDGRFKYPDLPSAVDNVAINLNLKNSGNVVDDILINLRELHFEILNKPFDAKLFVKTPESDPFVSGHLKGSINLEDLKSAIHMNDSIDIKGDIISNLEINGYPSAIEKNQPNRFSANGTVTFANIEYAAEDLPGPILVETATLNITPRDARLSNMRSKIGKSDLRADGDLEDIIGYVFGDKDLKGTLALQSNYFDLNPWMEGESTEMAPIELPGQIEFLLDANFRSVDYDNLKLSNVRGNLLLKDKKLNLMDLKMNTLNGNILANGSYSYLPPAKPKMFFDLELAELSIPQMFTSMVSVQKIAPIAEYMQGAVNGKLSLSSSLDDALMPDWTDLFSKGKLNIDKATIRNFAPFNKLAETLKINQLHNPALNNIRPSYEVKNGRFHLKPLEFQVDKYKMVASGSNGFDKSLDYNIQVQIPAKELNNQINSQISSLLKRNVSTLNNETVNVDVKIGGTTEKPSLKTAGASVLQSATDPLKAAAQNEVDKQKSAAEAKAQAALEKQKQELEKQKKEAEEKLKNKLKSIFGKKKKE